jgi:carbon storage regulator CsrA
MLVLSRRLNDKIVFPTLGISVEILRVDGRTVRVGVEAPKSVPVIRAELAGTQREPIEPALSKPAARQLDHELRGRLNTATVALFVAQKQLEIGDTTAAQRTLREALGVFAALEKELESSPAKAARASHRLSALLVEENVNESALLAGYLRLSGIDVDAVNDGQAALDYFATMGRPDVVLLDMRLPSRSGPEILESVRSYPSRCDLKVFAVTGSSSSEFELPTSPKGVDGWFSKPLNPPHMIEAIMCAVNLNGNKAVTGSRGIKTESGREHALGPHGFGEHRSTP